MISQKKEEFKYSSFFAVYNIALLFWLSVSRNIYLDGSLFQYKQKE
nr:MAG TPA: hypothetical protein [Caudoviricetes sp.]